jgi:hypothetical protein
MADAINDFARLTHHLRALWQKGHRKNRRRLSALRFSACDKETSAMTKNIVALGFVGLFAVSLTGCRAQMVQAAKNDCIQMGYEGQALSDCTFAQFHLKEVEFQQGMANMQQGFANANHILYGN